jgi:hypothetical protein
MTKDFMIRIKKDILSGETDGLPPKFSAQICYIREDERSVMNFHLIVDNVSICNGEFRGVYAFPPEPQSGAVTDIPEVIELKRRLAGKVAASVYQYESSSPEVMARIDKAVERLRSAVETKFREETEQKIKRIIGMENTALEREIVSVLELSGF